MGTTGNRTRHTITEGSLQISSTISLTYFTDFLFSLLKLIIHYTKQSGFPLIVLNTRKTKNAILNSGSKMRF